MGVLCTHHHCERRGGTQSSARCRGSKKANYDTPAGTVLVSRLCPLHFMVRYSDVFAPKAPGEQHSCVGTKGMGLLELHHFTCGLAE